MQYIKVKDVVDYIANILRTEFESSFVPLTGGTMTGKLTVPTIDVTQKLSSLYIEAAQLSAGNLSCVKLSADDAYIKNRLDTTGIMTTDLTARNTAQLTARYAQYS